MNISGITYANKRNAKLGRTIMLTLIILILLAVTAIFGISAYVGWSLIHPEKRSLPKFSSNIVIEYDDIQFKDISKAIPLKGWYFKAKGSDKTIIMAHGYKNNRLQFEERTLEMISGLQSKGFNVLTFDFRNSGISGGDKTTIGIYETDDLLGAIKYAKSLGNKHIVLMGFSMGASTSIHTAAQSPDVEAVIADSPFDDLDTYLKDNLSVWSNLPKFPFNETILLTVKLMANVDPKKLSPKEDIKSIAPRPVMLIHGEDDNSIPIRNSEELYNAYSGKNTENITFWRVDGARHVGSYEKDTKEYMNRVYDFLGKVYGDK
ncbi:MAG TPA: alpha/beta hydrolase [Pseudobacteroides sp.]|uniref:alpha/beta hydrolase n=1 Tax=Pseudobacteroides sp. TaxID=1968840 RepID=UPI002F9318F9